MAQRSLHCPACFQPIPVPEDRGRPTVECPWCGAVVESDTGRQLSPGMQPGAALVWGPGGLPFQQRGVPGWAIGLIVGGVVLFAACAGLTAWAVWKLNQEPPEPPPRVEGTSADATPTPGPAYNSEAPLRPGDDGRLQVSFNPWTVYAHDDFKGYGFKATGGRAPYKWTLSGDLPPGVSHTLTVTRYPDGEIYTFEGHAGMAWDYPLAMTVADADGSEASAKGVLKVLPIPAFAGSLEATTSVYESFHGPPTTAGPEAVVPVGLQFHGEVKFTPAKEVRHARVFSYDHSAAPAWMKCEVDRDRLFFGGTPEIAGAVKFTFKAVARVDGCGHDFELSQEIAIDVTPLREDEIPDPVGVLSAADISGRVAVPIEHVVSFTAPRPQTWNSRRAWQVDARWDVDLRAMNASVPKGVVVSKRNARDGEAPMYLIGGIPEEGGEWELEFKLRVTVKYVDEPYEFAVDLKIRVEPLRDDQIPTAMPPPLSDDWVVHGAVGHDLKSTLTYNRPYRPATWTHDMRWGFTWEWLVDEIEAPEGVVFEIFNPGGQSGYPHLVMKGRVANKGEWEFEIKVKLKVKYVDATYEAVQKVKLTIK